MNAAKNKVEKTNEEVKREVKEENETENEKTEKVEKIKKEENVRWIQVWKGNARYGNSEYISLRADRAISVITRGLEGGERGDGASGGCGGAAIREEGRGPFDPLSPSTFTLSISLAEEKDGAAGAPRAAGR